MMMWKWKIFDYFLNVFMDNNEALWNTLSAFMDNIEPLWNTLKTQDIYYSKYSLKRNQGLKVIKNQIKHLLHIIVKNMFNVPKATHITVNFLRFSFNTFNSSVQVISLFLYFFFSLPFLSILETCHFLFHLYLHFNQTLDQAV